VKEMIRDKQDDTSAIKELITSFLTDTISIAEKAILNKWINEDPKNRMLFDEMLKTWQFSGTLNKSDGENTITVWNKLKREILINEDQKNSIPNTFLNPRKYTIPNRILVWAASVVLAFFIGGTAFYLFSGKGNIYVKPPIYQVYTPNGTRSEIFLADGTKVWLNAGSTLKYAYDFNNRKREVELIGEAYFQVKTDKSKPFTVRSSGIKVQALGTSFNIKAYPEDDSFVATLVEGKLTLEGNSKGKGSFKYVMSPRQKIVCIKSPTRVSNPGQGKTDNEATTKSGNEFVTPQITKVQVASNVNTELYTSWKDNRWVFESESLLNLAIMLERRFNVRILYDPNELINLTFTGIIENESLDQVLNILKLSAPLKYEFGKGQVRIDIDKNQQKRFQRLIKE